MIHGYLPVTLKTGVSLASTAQVQSIEGHRQQIPGVYPPKAGDGSKPWTGVFGE